MRRIVFILFLVVAMVAWCTPSFAVRQSVDVSGTVDTNGQTSGVDMINGAGTLTVGASFPNIGAVSGPSVTTTAENTDSILFNINLTSTVAGDIGTSSLYFKDITVSNGTSVNFNGTVFTTATAGAFKVGTGTVNFNSGTGTNKAAITFTDDGTVNLAANTFVTGAMITNTASTGTLALAGGSKVVGAVTGLKAINVTPVSDIVGVVGTVNGAATQIKNFSLLTNELNITGGILTIATDGVINTRIASPTLYGHILVQDGYASNLGTGLGVVVTVPSGTYIPLGTIFDIVESTSGTGALATVNYAAASGYEFKVATSTAGDAVILTTKVADAQAVPVAAPLAPLVAAAAASPDLLDVLSNINALSGSAQDNATAQLNPSTPSLAAPLVTFQGAREFQNLWLSRLDMCGQVSWPDKDKSTCKGEDSRSGWWLKGFGYFGEQDARADSTGYDSRIIGTMLAYDAPLGLDTRAGVGIGYARSKIDGKTYDAETDFDTYQATAYIGHDQGPWFVHGSASFGWNEYSDRRHIEFPGVDRTANANYSGQDYTAFARTGYHFPVQKFTITPLASLQYSRVNIDGYTEKDAGDVNLKVKSQHYDFLESGLGAKVERDFSYRDWAFVPEIHFEWLHKLSNPKLAQSAEYAVGSSEFTTYGLKTVADTYHVGTGLTLLSCACSATRWSLEAGYDYYWRVDGYAANQVTARVTARF